MDIGRHQNQPFVQGTLLQTEQTMDCGFVKRVAAIAVNRLSGVSNHFSPSQGMDGTEPVP